MLSELQHRSDAAAESERAAFRDKLEADELSLPPVTIPNDRPYNVS